ncbi:hypothetical protein [Mangrovibacterium sp.]|uniref:hypothetical protein n=1 Tax=Mangrovibacterium sp. TaxID=1961364 RepID=UPI0035634BCE
MWSMLRYKEFGMALCLLLFFASCDKEEGEGGTSTNAGNDYLLNYTSEFSLKSREYYAPNVDFFIVCGNDRIQADKTEPNNNGWYRVEYLNKETYTVYTHSKDPEQHSPSGKIRVKQTIQTTDYITTTYFRNRIQSSYNVKGIPPEASISYELLWSVNNYSAQQIEKFRFVA